MTSTDDLRTAPRGPARTGSRDAVAPPRASAPEEHFTVTVDRRSRRPVVIAAGELDAASAPLLEAVIQHVTDQGARGPVLVDLAAVDFADTHGLAPVLDRATEIRAASTAVHRVLRLLRIPGPRLPGPVHVR